MIELHFSQYDQRVKGKSIFNLKNIISDDKIIFHEFHIAVS